MKKRWIFVLIAVVAIFGLTIFSLKNKISKGAEVKTVSISKGDIVAYFSTSGSVESVNKKDYYSQGTSKVVRTYVKVGDKVKKGDTLIEFEVQDLSIQLKTAQIQYDSAKIQLDNLKQQRDNLTKVPQQGVGQTINPQTTAAQSADSINNQIKMQENQLKIAKLNIDSVNQNIVKQQKYIKADFDGVVTALNAKMGEITSMQQPSVSVEDTDNLIVTVNVNQYDIAKIKQGQDAVLNFNEKSFKGVVDTINPVATKTMSASGTDTIIKVTIKIIENDGTLKSGFDVDANIKLGGKSGIIKLPTEAIITDKDGNEKVFIVKNNIAKSADIKTGLESDVEAEVTSGLSEGDRVILNPPSTIRDGVKVLDKGVK